MKNKIFVLYILLFSFFLCGAAFENDLVDKQFSALEKYENTSALSEETKEILSAIGIEEADAEKILSFSLKDLIKLVCESLIHKIKEPIKAIASVTAAVLICSLIKNFCEDFSAAGKIVNFSAVIAVSCAIMLPLKNVIEYSAKVIEESSDFMLGFIPVYSSAAVSCGNVSSAVSYRTLMLGTATAISQLSSEIVMPLISIYFAMCIAGSVSDLNIGEISKYFKNFSVWILGASMTVFSGILGLGTLISSSADSSFNKTAKFLIGSAVPVVGSTISDALTTLKGCLSVTKNVFGIYGIIVTAAIFIPPIISVISWKICLSAASAVCGIAENKELCGLLKAASYVMGIMLALLVSISIMFIFSVAVLLMAGGALP